MEKLIKAINGAANMMRGMLMDPSIPLHAKQAMQAKIGELDQMAEPFAEVPVGNACVMGDIELYEDGEPCPVKQCLVIEFKTVREIKQAIREGCCEFTVLGGPAESKEKAEG